MEASFLPEHNLLPGTKPVSPWKYRFLSQLGRGDFHLWGQGCDGLQALLIFLWDCWALSSFWTALSSFWAAVPLFALLKPRTNQIAWYHNSAFKVCAKRRAWNYAAITCNHPVFSSGDWHAPSKRYLFQKTFRGTEQPFSSTSFLEENCSTQATLSLKCDKHVAFLAIRLSIYVLISKHGIIWLSASHISPFLLHALSKTFINAHSYSMHAKNE